MSGDFKPEELNISELTELLKRNFEAGAGVTLTVTGFSMGPYLKNLRDSVVLVSPEVRPPKRLDIVLFRRDDGKPVLHRVIGAKPDELTINGDAQTWCEKIRPGQVMAVADGLIRKNRYVSCGSLSYRLYSGLWVSLKPLRPAAIWAYARLKGRQAKP